MYAKSIQNHDCEQCMFFVYTKKGYTPKINYCIIVAQHNTEVRHMLKMKTNVEIGEYLSNLISKKYSKTRRFCKEYLKLEGTPLNDEEIRKMANRMSQILKGAKAIQPYDLPIFTELLGVTCEQILSAGECSAQKNRRVTNYSISFSKSQKEWDEYINRDDKLILNPDEYNKTALDYAIEAGNYKLIKYLMDKQYIWFVDNEDILVLKRHAQRHFRALDADVVLRHGQAHHLTCVDAVDGTPLLAVQGHTVLHPFEFDHHPIGESAPTAQEGL